MRRLILSAAFGFALAAATPAFAGGNGVTSSQSQSGDNPVADRGVAGSITEANKLHAQPSTSGAPGGADERSGATAGQRDDRRPGDPSDHVAGGRTTGDTGRSSPSNGQ